MDFKDYYKSELDKLPKNFEYTPTIVIYHEGEKTKHLSLNEDSLKALIEFCKENKIK